MKKYLTIILALGLFLSLPIQTRAAEYTNSQCETHPSMNLIFSRIEEDIAKVQQAINDKECSSFTAKRTYYFTHVKQLLFDIQKLGSSFRLALPNRIKNFTHFPLIALIDPGASFWPKERESEAFDIYNDRIQGLVNTAGNKCALDDSIKIDELPVGKFIQQILLKIAASQNALLSDFDDYNSETPDLANISDSYVKDLYQTDSSNLTELISFYGRSNFLVCPNPVGLGSTILKLNTLDKNIKLLKNNLIRFGKEAF